MIIVSVCLPSDVLSQHLLSHMGFSYLGRRVSLTLDVGYLLPWTWGISSRLLQQSTARLLLTLDEGYLLTTALPDLQCGIAPLGPPAPEQPPLLGLGLIFLGVAPSLGHGVAPPGP